MNIFQAAADSVGKPPNPEYFSGNKEKIADLQKKIDKAMTDYSKISGVHIPYEITSMHAGGAEGDGTYGDEYIFGQIFYIKITQGGLRDMYITVGPEKSLLGTEMMDVNNPIIIRGSIFVDGARVSFSYRAKTQELHFLHISPGQAALLGLELSNRALGILRKVNYEDDVFSREVQGPSEGADLINGYLTEHLGENYKSLFDSLLAASTINQDWI